MRGFGVSQVGQHKLLKNFDFRGGTRPDLKYPYFTVYLWRRCVLRTCLCIYSRSLYRDWVKGSLGTPGGVAPGPPILSSVKVSTAHTLTQLIILDLTRGNGEVLGYLTTRNTNYWKIWILGGVQGQTWNTPILLYIFDSHAFNECVWVYIHVVCTGMWYRVS